LAGKLAAGVQLWRLFMIDHRYLSEMSKALHIFLEFSILVCGALICARFAVAAQTAPATAKAPRVQDQRGP
jgi:hypothetical protein